MSLVRLVLAVLALLTLVTAPGCGGGGGGGGGGGPTGPQPGITLTPVAGSSPSIRLAAGAGTTTTALDLEIRADGVSDLYGLAFDLSYPSAQLRFEGFTEGGFLAGAGTSTSLQVVRDGDGRLVVGFTRLGAAAGVSGSGLLVVVRFSVVASGQGNLVFLRNRSFSPAGTVQNGVSWLGANVVLVQ